MRHKFDLQIPGCFSIQKPALSRCWKSRAASKNC